MQIRLDRPLKRCPYSLHVFFFIQTPARSLGETNIDNSMRQLTSDQTQRRVVTTYTPYMGNRRVYSTKWLNRWVNWERNHPQDRQGNPIRVIHETVDYKRVRNYAYDKDMHRMASVSEWDIRRRKQPNDIPYLRAKRIGSMSLYAISCLSGEQLVQAIERECHSDSMRHRDGGENRWVRHL